MPAFFFDFSALAKLYHSELGTEAVDRIVGTPDHIVRISRLATIELPSVFAIKVRTGFITRNDAELLLRQLREDIACKRFEVFGIGDVEYAGAEWLIERHAFDLRLRTLDALRLAVALSLKRQSLLDHFVTADKILCDVARLEGFSVINPEEA